MLISVIIPVYNTETYIRNCIESVINQTYTNIEIILVDDGSTDNCGQICDAYAKSDSRIRVFHNKNGGLSKARNFGIGKSNGQFVTFVDSDDLIDTDFLQTLVCLQKKHSADIVQCNRYYNTEDKDEEFEIETVYSNIEAQYLLFGKYYIPTVNSTCKLINKKIFDHLSFEIGRIHEDEFIIHRLLHLANKLVFINKRMYCVNRSPNSITRSKYSIKRLDYISALEDRMEFYKDIHSDELYALVLYGYVVALKTNIVKMEINCPHHKEIIKQLKGKFHKSLATAFKNKNLTIRNKASLFCKCALKRS